jgi:RNA polymerase sigma factor (sigma-70 family)
MTETLVIDRDEAEMQPGVSLLALDQYQREVDYIRHAGATREELLKWLRQVMRGNRERLKDQPNQWYLSVAGHARTCLVEEFQPLVLGLAYQMYYRSGRAMEVLDLVSEGNIGLLSLLDRVGREQEVAFPAFLVLVQKYVTGTMLSVLRSNRMTGRPHSFRRQMQEVARVCDELAVQLDRQPSYRELAHKMGLEVEKICTLMESHHLEYPLSLEALAEEYEGEDHGGAMSLYEQGAPVDEPAEQEEKALLQWAMAEVLTDREREVIRLRFGLDGPVHTQAEVERLLGVSDSTVAKCEKRALEVLHQVVECRGIPDAGLVTTLLRGRIPEGYYTVQQAARVLEVSCAQVQRLALRGRLPGERARRSMLDQRGIWLLPKQAVDEYAVRQQTGLSLLEEVPEDCYTTVQAAQVLGVASREAVRKLIQRGRLPGKLVRSFPSDQVGMWLLPKQAVDELAVQRRGVAGRQVAVCREASLVACD